MITRHLTICAATFNLSVTSNPFRRKVRSNLCHLNILLYMVIYGYAFALWLLGVAPADPHDPELRKKLVLKVVLCRWICPRAKNTLPLVVVSAPTTFSLLVCVFYVPFLFLQLLWAAPQSRWFSSEHFLLKWLRKMSMLCVYDIIFFLTPAPLSSAFFLLVSGFCCWCWNSSFSPQGSL